MRILYAGQSPSEPKGGGELSALAILRKLASYHEVRVVGAASEDAQCSTFKEMDVFNYALPAAQGMLLQSGHTSREAKFRRIIRDHVALFKPHLLLLQSPGYLLPGDLHQDTRLVMFVRSPLCFGCWDPNPIYWRSAIASLLSFKRFQKFKPLLQRANLIVSNSDYMQAELLKKRHLNSVSIPPLIEIKEQGQQRASPSLRDNITLVGLDPWKGGKLAIRLAQAMPQRPFLFVAGNRASSKLLNQAAGLDNVKLAGWTDDMNAHYLKTRVIIMPSLWSEPFGRVAVEAGRHEIPTIATATGGLPEAVGAGGILLARDAGLTAWINAIESMDDSSRYEQLASRARQHAERFTPTRIFDQLDSAVLEHTGLKLLDDTGSDSKPVVSGLDL